ncbi:MAG: type II secretion system protein [Armatimonadota bacterium]
MRSRTVPRFALRAFTLLELLVVVAILSVLAGILLPVLAKARQRAYQSVCLSNLKQMGSAFALYIESWDDKFPLLRVYRKVLCGRCREEMDAVEDVEACTASIPKKH